MPQFVIRDGSIADLDGLYTVAEHLDSVNLPHDRQVLDGQLHHAQQSFSGALDVFKREYLFVLSACEDGSERVIGTSMIHAQHGTRRAPHIFYDVMSDERYSETLDKHFVHQVLRIGYNYNGPTEIGGLILQPSYRGGQGSAGLALGKWLSYVRFLYMARHRQNFRDEVLSELLPPLGDDGTSLLWEHLGRHFTGLSYQEADRVSKTNKEFIRTLFPSEPIYTCLMPQHVQQLIGQVGPDTRGVEKMLRRIGFRYANRIDPFDGGPHFVARTDDITLLRTVTKAKVMHVDSADEGRPFGLICVERDQPPYFTATGSRYRLEEGQVGLPEVTRRLLGVQPGDEVGILPT